MIYTPFLHAVLPKHSRRSSSRAMQKGFQILHPTERIVRQCHESWDMRDPDRGAAIIADDCDFEDVARGEKLPGKDAYKADYRAGARPSQTDFARSKMSGSANAANGPRLTFAIQAPALEPCAQASEILHQQANEPKFAIAR